MRTGTYSMSERIDQHDTARVGIDPAGVDIDEFIGCFNRSCHPFVLASCLDKVSGGERRSTEYLRNRMCRKDPFVRHSRSSDRPIHIRDAPHSEADRSLALAYP